MGVGDKACAYEVGEVVIGVVASVERGVSVFGVAVVVLCVCVVHPKCFGGY